MDFGIASNLIPAILSAPEKAAEFFAMRGTPPSGAWMPPPAGTGFAPATDNSQWTSPTTGAAPAFGGAINPMAQAMNLGTIGQAINPPQQQKPNIPAAPGAAHAPLGSIPQNNIIQMIQALQAGMQQGPAAKSLGALVLGR